MNQITLKERKDALAHRFGLLELHNESHVPNAVIAENQRSGLHAAPHVLEELHPKRTRKERKD